MDKSPLTDLSRPPFKEGDVVTTDFEPEFSFVPRRVVAVRFIDGKWKVSVDGGQWYHMHSRARFLHLISAERLEPYSLEEDNGDS